MPVLSKLKGMRAPVQQLHPEIFRPVWPVSGPPRNCREGFSTWHIVVAGLASATFRARFLRATRQVWADKLIADLQEATFQPITDNCVRASGGTVTQESVPPPTKCSS